MKSSSAGQRELESTLYTVMPIGRFLTTAYSLQPSAYGPIATAETRLRNQRIQLKDRQQHGQYDDEYERTHEKDHERAYQVDDGRQ